MDQDSYLKTVWQNSCRASGARKEKSSKSFYGPFLAPSPQSPSKQWVAFYYEEQGAVKAPFQLGWRNCTEQQKEKKLLLKYKSTCLKGLIRELVVFNAYCPLVLDWRTKKLIDYKKLLGLDKDDEMPAAIRQVDQARFSLAAQFQSCERSFLLALSIIIGGGNETMAVINWSTQLENSFSIIIFVGASFYSSV